MSEAIVESKTETQEALLATLGVLADAGVSANQATAVYRSLMLSRAEEQRAAGNSPISLGGSDVGVIYAHREATRLSLDTIVPTVERFEQALVRGIARNCGVDLSPYFFDELDTREGDAVFCANSFAFALYKLREGGE